MTRGEVIRRFLVGLRGTGRTMTSDGMRLTSFGHYLAWWDLDGVVVIRTRSIETCGMREHRREVQRTAHALGYPVTILTGGGPHGERNQTEGTPRRNGLSGRNTNRGGTPPAVREAIESIWQAHGQGRPTECGSVGPGRKVANRRGPTTGGTGRGGSVCHEGQRRKKRGAESVDNADETRPPNQGCRE